MFCWFCSLNTVILCVTDAWLILCTNKIYTYVLKKSYFIFPITKGSVNALMKLAGLRTSNRVKNHCFKGIYLKDNAKLQESLECAFNVCRSSNFPHLSPDYPAPLVSYLTVGRSLRMGNIMQRPKERRKYFI